MMSNKYFIPRSKIESVTDSISQYTSLWETLRTDLAYKLIMKDISSGNLSVDKYVSIWFGLRWVKKRRTLEELLAAWYSRKCDGSRSNYTCVSEKLTVVCENSKNQQWIQMSHFISGYGRRYLHKDTGALYEVMKAWLSVTDSEELSVNEKQLKTFEILYTGLPIASKAATEYISENSPLKTYQDLRNDCDLKVENQEGS